MLGPSGIPAAPLLKQTNKQICLATIHQPIISSIDEWSVGAELDGFSVGLDLRAEAQPYISPLKSLHYQSNWQFDN